MSYRDCVGSAGGPRSARPDEGSHRVDALENMDDMDAWIAAIEAQEPFKAFDLSTAEGRESLLRKYYRIGDTALFEAVGHLWDSLNEPRSAFGTQIGLAAGTGGHGKIGVMLALQKFLAEALDSAVPIPEVSDFNSLDEWHHASMQTFVSEEECLASLVQRYAIILDGKKPSPASASPGLLIQGPWRSDGGADEGFSLAVDELT